ncbi:hypothetical protein SO694_00044299 [Aureococcus anophagefferens]|uniref:WW domain-containing protein n=1 Tax=Aureococcus anophagefferens TaxID=44056 RepID=A0ABR1G7C9_AURAN
MASSASPLRVVAANPAEPLVASPRRAAAAPPPPPRAAVSTPPLFEEAPLAARHDLDQPARAPRAERARAARRRHRPPSSSATTPAAASRAPTTPSRTTSARARSSPGGRRRRRAARPPRRTSARARARARAAARSRGLRARAPQNIAAPPQPPAATPAAMPRPAAPPDSRDPAGAPARDDRSPLAPEMTVGRGAHGDRSRGAAPYSGGAAPDAAAPRPQPADADALAAVRSLEKRLGRARDAARGGSPRRATGGAAEATVASLETSHRGVFDELRSLRDELAAERSTSPRAVDAAVGGAPRADGRRATRRSRSASARSGALEAAARDAASSPSPRDDDSIVDVLDRNFRELRSEVRRSARAPAAEPAPARPDGGDDRYRSALRRLGLERLDPLGEAGAPVAPGSRARAAAAAAAGPAAAAQRRRGRPPNGAKSPSGAAVAGADVDRGRARGAHGRAARGGGGARAARARARAREAGDAFHPGRGRGISHFLHDDGIDLDEHAKRKRGSPSPSPAARAERVAGRAEARPRGRGGAPSPSRPRGSGVFYSVVDGDAPAAPRAADGRPTAPTTRGAAAGPRRRRGGPSTGRRARGLRGPAGHGGPDARRLRARGRSPTVGDLAPPPSSRSASRERRAATARAARRRRRPRRRPARRRRARPGRAAAPARAPGGPPAPRGTLGAAAVAALALSPPDAGARAPPSVVSVASEPRRSTPSRSPGDAASARSRTPESAAESRRTWSERSDDRRGRDRGGWHAESPQSLYTATSDPDLSRSLGRGVSEPDTSRASARATRTRATSPRGAAPRRLPGRRDGPSPERPRRDAYLAGRDGRGGDDAGDARRDGEDHGGSSRRFGRQGDDGRGGTSRRFGHGKEDEDDDYGSRRFDHRSGEEGDRSRRYGHGDDDDGYGSRRFGRRDDDDGYGSRRFGRPQRATTIRGATGAAATTTPTAARRGASAGPRGRPTRPPRARRARTPSLSARFAGGGAASRPSAPGRDVVLGARAAGRASPEEAYARFTARRSPERAATSRDRSVDLKRYARHADSDSDGEHRSVAAAELLNEATASALDMRGAKMGVLGEVLERAEADAAALRRKRQAKLLATEKELASRSARVLGPACGVVGPDGRSATLVALEAAHAAAKADGAGERRTLVALLGDEIRLQEEHERRLAALDDDLDAAKARDDFERCILLEQERKEAVASRRGLLEAIAVASSERSPRRELDVLEEELVNRRTAADLATAAPKPRLKRHEDPEPLAEEVARSNLVKAGPLGVFDEATSAWSSRDVELATDPADATSASLYVYDRDGPPRVVRVADVVSLEVPRKSRDFEIATDDATFHLRAPTTKERDAWLAALDPFLPAERADDAAAAGAGKECEIPNFKGSSLGRFPLASADCWTSDHLSERSRSAAAPPPDASLAVAAKKLNHARRGTTPEPEPRRFVVWEERHDPASGRAYYFCPETGVSSWEMPAELAKAAAADDDADDGRLKRMLSQAPRRASHVNESLNLTTQFEADAWEERADPATGRSYYFNAQTGESTWSPPANAPIRRAA